MYKEMKVRLKAWEVMNSDEEFYVGKLVLTCIPVETSNQDWKLPSSSGKVGGSVKPFSFGRRSWSCSSASSKLSL